MVISLDGAQPTLAADVFIAPGAVVVGDVEVGPRSSLWFQSVVRGDVFPIRIGARVNIQDGVIVHVTRGKHATIIGDDVTIGHRAIIHGCELQGPCLIGMGATVMDGAVVEPYAMVAAGALVTPGTRIPSGMLAVGTPAKIRRPLTPEERLNIDNLASHYADLAEQYRGSSTLVEGEEQG